MALSQTLKTKVQSTKFKVPGSEIDYLMLIRSYIDRMVDPVRHVAAVAGEQRSDVDVALLQFFVRVELIEGALQLAVRGFVARHLGAVKTRAQSLKLIINLAPTGFQGVR